MAYEISGTLKKIMERQDFPSGFYKQEFVVTTEERFPQDIKLDCLKEKVELLQPFKEGDRIKVAFDLRGREWNERYFVDLSAWKIEAADAEASGTGAPPPAETIPAEDPGPYNEEEDVPF
jgi:single-strand DNA-binding protein